MSVRYGAATIAVLAAAAARALLNPIFGSHHPYTAFYPAVVITAYAMGLRPALAASALAAAIGLIGFSLPSMRPGQEIGVAAGVSFFLVNCAVAVWIISALVEALGRVSMEQAKTDALATAQADMFRDLNERHGHHLQLVSGLLALRSRNEAEPQLSDALAKASERSLVLARLHRELRSEAGAAVDLNGMAAKLIGSLVASRGEAADMVELAGPPVQVSAEEATSVAIALLECADSLLARPDPLPFRVAFAKTTKSIVCRISEVHPPLTDRVETALDEQLLLAALDQVNGTVSLVREPVGLTVELSFPRPDRVGPSILH